MSTDVSCRGYDNASDVNNFTCLWTEDPPYLTRDWPLTGFPEAAPPMGHTILLVEDSVTDVLLMKESLACSNFEHCLHTVSDGAEAASFLRNEGKYENAPRPSLILLDINLPKKNGREVLAEIKSDKRLKLIPVVVLTTSKNEKDVRDAYSLNANCYIVKPLDYYKFSDVVRIIETFWFGVATLADEC